MVERIQEGMTAPNPETKFHVLETTLAELGLDTASDNLNLAADKFTLGVKKVGENTVFVGLLHHGLAGGHKAQFLNNVSPFPDQNLRAIIDDVSLPILAERDRLNGGSKDTSTYIFLHERHLGDPRIAPAYKRFASDHADSWLRALEFSNGSEVFESAQRVRFINSTEDIRKELFFEDGSFFNFLSDSEVFIGTYRALKIFHHDRFSLISEDLGKEVGTNEIVEAVLKSFTKEEQKEFATAYFPLSKEQILVNLDIHRIIGEGYLDSRIRLRTSISFADNGRDVVVSDDRGTKVVLSPTGQSGRFSWKVIEYQFPAGYEESSLCPIVAWKIDANGNRVFLTQQEAMPFVREFHLSEGERGDTKLGEITVASFARNIIKGWEQKMTLKPLEGVQRRVNRDDFEQPMKGAQMPAWVGIERHKDELLNGETSPLAVIESNLAFAA